MDVYEDILWSGYWLWCIMHEGKFGGMLPFFDYVGPHSEKARIFENVQLDFRISRPCGHKHAQVQVGRIQVPGRD